MFLVALAYLAFFSIALPDSMLGVAWPSMRLAFEQPTSAAGLVPPIGVVATLISTSLAGYIVARLGVGRLLAAGTLLSTLGLLVSAASQTFLHFLISVVLIGLSAGAVDATLNAYAARTFGPRRINLLHASYGVGAAVSPLIVTATIATGSSWRLAYVIVAVLQLILSITFFFTSRRWNTDSTPTAPGSNSEPMTAAPKLSGRVWTVDSGLGLLTVLVQTGIESSAALWAYTFLTLGLGVDPVVAGLISSGYWVTMIVGRVAFGALAERLGAWQVMSIAVLGLVGAAALTNFGHTWTTMVMIGVVLIGLTTAPIYPLLIITTAERTSPEVADRVVGFQAGASSLGAAVLPLLIGLAMGRSVTLFAPALLALAVVAALLQLALRARVKRKVKPLP